MINYMISYMSIICLLKNTNYHEWPTNYHEYYMINYMINYMSIIC